LLRLSARRSYGVQCGLYDGTVARVLLADLDEFPEELEGVLALVEGGVPHSHPEDLLVILHQGDAAASRWNDQPFLLHLYDVHLHEELEEVVDAGHGILVVLVGQEDPDQGLEELAIEYQFGGGS